MLCQPELLVQGPLRSVFSGIDVDHYLNRFYSEDMEVRQQVLSAAVDNLSSYAPIETAEAFRYWQMAASIVDVVGQDYSLDIGSFDQQLDQILSNAGHVFTAAGLRNGSLILGTAEAETIDGDNYNNTIQGGLGNDTLDGGAGSDTYVYASGDGNDLINQGYASGTDTLQFSDINASGVTLASAANDPDDLIITITATGQTIRINEQFYTTLSSNYGIEQIVFADGTTWNQAAMIAATAFFLPGTQGDDTLVGGSNNDTIQGGLGNDTLDGGAGSDTYVYASGDGNDLINQTYGAGTDTLQFTGINASGVTLASAANDPDDLIITVTATGQTIRINEQFYTTLSSNYGIEQIVFADGTTWNQAAMIAATAFFLPGTQGDDTLVGGSNNDTIQGGLGNDTLDGGAGSDTYVYASGDGNDLINQTYGAGTDTLQFTGINASGVTLASAANDPDDLIITVTATGQTIRINEQFYTTLSSNYGIEQIVFADGTTWNQAAMIAATAFFLPGTQGDDTLVGGSNNDTIQGGLGNDTLDGGAGSDTYVYASGDGNDLINQTYGAGTDTLQFTGINASGVTLASAANDPDDLIITVTATGQTIRINEQFYTTLSSNYGIEQIVFADGTTWNQAAMIAATAFFLPGTQGDDTLVGGSNNDTIQGGLGNDTLDGGAGSDTYVYASGDGNDLINQTYGAGTDTLQFTGINASGVTLASAANDPDDLIITVTATGQTIRINEQFYTTLSSNYGIEQIVFADGTTWNQAAMIAATAFFLPGTQGDDTLVGGSNNDTIQGGLGNDTLDGGAGSDTYVYASGDGNDLINQTYGAGTDTLQFTGINASGVTLASAANDPDDLIITVTATGQTIRINEQFYTTLSSNYGIEQIVFADGTTWNQAAMIAATAFFLPGTQGDDTLVGGSNNDTIQGGLGNDTLDGGAGSDTYVYASGDGNDLINQTYGAGTDTLQFTGINASGVTLASAANDPDDLIITVTATGQTIRINEQFYTTLSSNYGIEQIVFADGTTWNQAAMIAATAFFLPGTQGDDTLVGGSNNDTIQGGLGNDTLDGGAGSDTYVYASGDGNDLINQAFNNGTDTLQFTNINASGITLAAAQNDYDDLVITITTTGQTIRVNEQFYTGLNYSIEQIVFADGTTWDLAAIAAATAIFGTAGNDTMWGNTQNNTLIGGLGNDTLDGGAGSDTYVYASGDGNDLINQAFNNGTDTLQFTNINASGITLAAAQDDYDDLVITITTTGQTIRVNEQFYTGLNYSIEQIVFADGTTWDLATIGAATSFVGTTGNDTIWGNTQNNTLIGGLGNDTLDGGAGSDTYVYASGDGNDLINQAFNNGTDTLQFTNINASGITLAAAQDDYDDLVITITTTGQTIRVNEQFYTGLNYSIEQIVFADGTTWDLATIGAATSFVGTTGNDTIWGNTQNNTLIGGLGNDTLDGGAGSDTYVYASGDGNDLINQAFNNGTDTLQFTNINASGITLAAAQDDYDDLVITITTTGQTIRVNEQFYTGLNYSIEQIVFADGTTWDLATIGAATSFVGTTGNDTIWGNTQNNTLIGGLGNDTLDGGAGSDTYVYASGDGNDLINQAFNNGTDTLQFTNINASGITLAAAQNDYDDLVITITTTGQTIRVNEQFYTGLNYSIEQIVFADGTTWDLATIGAATSFVGTTGNDTIWGNTQNNTLIGGLGNDTLDGGAGSDTYVYASGDGNDLINQAFNNGTDTLQFTNINASGITLAAAQDDYDDLVITITTTGQTIRVNEQFYTGLNYSIEQIVFADGTTWDQSTIAAMTQGQTLIGGAGNDALNGTVLADILYGLGGNDTLNGGAGDDILIGGTGNDTINSSTGSDTFVFASGDGNDFINEESGSTVEIDVLRLTNLNPSDVLLTRVGVDLMVDVLPTGERIEVDEHFWSTSSNYGIEKFEFADGTNWDRAKVNSEAWYRGTAGADTLTGSSWNDTFRGGGGNDTINSSTGSDTFVFSSGDGNDFINEESASTVEIDVLRLTNLNTSDILLTHIGTDLMVDVLATGERIEVDEHFWSTSSNYGIEKIEFADGTSWDRAKINSETWYRGTSNADTLTGSNFDDHIDGKGGNDIINGGSGNDFLDGGIGADTMSGSTGDDIYVVGEAGDAVTEASSQGTDEVRTTLASYTLGNNVENLRYTGSGAFTGTGNTLNNQLLGGLGDDTLNGGAGNDTLDGGAGNDALFGGAGNDVYWFDRGDGQDIIANQDADSLTTDRLQFGDVNTPDDLWLGQAGNDLIVSILGSSDRIRLTNWYTDTANQLDQFSISDGRTLNRSAVDQLVSAMASFTTTDGLADSSVQPGSVPSSVQLAINSSWTSGG